MKQLIRVLNILFFLALSSFDILSVTYLPLPASLADKAVYHVKARQINGWSCGYNVLFNACNVEQFFAKSNKNHDYNEFAKVCLPYLKSINRNPKASSNNHVMEKLSKYLKLQKFSYFSFNKSKESAPLISGPVKIVFPGKTSKAKIKLLLDAAWKKRQQEYVSQLKKTLSDAKGNPAFVHIACHISSTDGGHAVLASIVQDPAGKRALYIFDNMNILVKDGSQMKRHIDTLCSTFNIGSKK